MKLHFFAFLCFVLCTVQEIEVDDAFKAFFIFQNSFSREEFGKIATFISRVEVVKDSDIVSPQDMQTLLELGFTVLVHAFFPPRHPEEKIDFHITWGEINTFTKCIQNQKAEDCACKPFEYGMPLAQLLNFRFCFQTTDILTKEQFFDYNYLVDFLLGGNHSRKIKKMIQLHTVYGEAFSSSGLEYFASQENNVFEVLLSILTPSSLSIDLDELNIWFCANVISISIVTNILMH